MNKMKGKKCEVPSLMWNDCTYLIRNGMNDIDGCDDSQTMPSPLVALCGRL